jgi:hypothetical protein
MLRDDLRKPQIKSSLSGFKHLFLLENGEKVVMNHWKFMPTIVKITKWVRSKLVVNKCHRRFMTLLVF